MTKPGIIQLPKGFFPKLPTFSDQERAHMLILTGFDMGGGLSIVQSIPDLSEQDQSIAYSDKYKALVNINYPIIKSAISEEFVHARVISALNNAVGEEESPKYKMTFLFISDENNKNFKLAGIFTGDTDQGNWAAEEVVKGMAAVLAMPVYTKVDEKGNGDDAKEVPTK